MGASNVELMASVEAEQGEKISEREQDDFEYDGSLPPFLLR